MLNPSQNAPSGLFGPGPTFSGSVRPSRRASSRIDRGTSHVGCVSLTVTVKAPIGVAQIAFLDDPGEEALGQVLRLVGRMPLPSHEGEDRIPVERTESRESGLGSFGSPLAGGEDKAPLRGRETTAGIYRCLTAFWSRWPSA